MILEANTHGKPPTAASRIGGIPEVIQDGQMGFLFDHHGPDELRAKMLNLHQDKELCAEMGRQARAHVELYHKPEQHDRNLRIFAAVSDTDPYDTPCP